MAQRETRSGRSKPTPIKVTVSHTITLDLAQWINERAEKLGISKSDVLRRALVAAMEADAKAEAA